MPLPAWGWFDDQQEDVRPACPSSAACTVVSSEGSLSASSFIEIVCVPYTRPCKVHTACFRTQQGLPSTAQAAVCLYGLVLGIT